MNNDKNNFKILGNSTDPNRPGIRTVHKNYGLRISHFQKKIHAPSKKISDGVYKRKFEFYSLSHVLEGDAWYWTPEKGVKFFNPGWAILSTPYSIQDYGSENSDFVEDYICFTGAIADNLLKCGIIRPGLVKMGEDRKLLDIINTARRPNDDSQIQANLKLQNLLTDLYINKKWESQTTLLPFKKINILLTMLNDNIEKWWSVEEMAELCELSKNHFRRIFVKKTGMTPKIYIEKLKITKACEYLCSSDISITQISQMLSYKDQYHFSKVFKKNSGFSPSMYRKKYMRK